MCSNYVRLCHTNINCRSVGRATSTKIGNVNVPNICLFPLGMSPIRIAPMPMLAAADDVVVVLMVDGDDDDTKRKSNIQRRQ